MATKKLNILLIHFNRPELLKSQLSSLEKIQDYNFHVFLSIDGPRNQNNDDLKARSEFIKILNNEGNLNIKLNLINENLGCKKGVESGLDWFFKIVDKGIVFEDDIQITHESLNFFNYWLAKTDEYVISAFSIPETSKPWLSKHGSVWGWACNGKIWKSYRENLDKKFKFKALRSFESFKEFFVLLTWFFQSNLKRIDTWDFDWNLYRRANNIYTVMPPKSLVTNIGFSSKGTHTKTDIPYWMPSIMNISDLDIENKNIKFSKTLEKEYFFHKYSKVPYRFVLSELIKSFLFRIMERLKII